MAVIRENYLRIRTEAIAYCIERELWIASACTGEERILLACLLRLGTNSAARDQPFSKGTAGFASALIRIGPDVNAPRVPASLRAQQSLAGQPVSVVATEQFDQLTAMRRQLPWRDTPYRPRLSRVLIESRAIPGRRANTVTAYDHDVSQLLLGIRNMRYAEDSRDNG
jgi:hypothetical protein